MIYITQLIFIIKGHEQIFDEFESVAIPLILKHNGRLLLRVRPIENAFIETHIDKPYEIHLMVFKTQKDFNNFMLDSVRTKFLYLKEQSIKTSILIKGEKL